MSITSTTIQLTYCPAVDETSVCGYNIYDASDDSLIGSTDADTFIYTVTGLSPLTTYEFYITAFDCVGNNESTPSNTITVTTTDGVDDPMPDDVINFNYFNVDHDSANLTWQAIGDWGPNGIGGYNIYYENGTLFHQSVGVNAYYDPTNLTSSTTYSLKVKAYDSLGNESANYSNTITFTTDSSPVQVPTTPQNLTIDNVTGTSIFLSWDASTFYNGIGGYRVYNELGVLLKTIPGSDIDTIMTNLFPDTEYSYKVKAYDGLGYESDFSNTVTATTDDILSTPTNFGSFAAQVNGGNPDWTNINNILSSGSVASSTIPVGGESDRIYVNDFGFAIPLTATITGIELDIYRSSLYGSVNVMVSQLMDGVVPIGNPRQLNGAWNTLGGLITQGWDTDMWGTTLTPADINGSTFGASIIAGNQGSISDDAELDYIKIVVYYIE